MVEHGNKYYHMGSSAKSFNNAIDYCADRGMVLASIKTPQDYRQLYSFIGEINGLESLCNKCNPHPDKIIGQKK